MLEASSSPIVNLAGFRRTRFDLVGKMLGRVVCLIEAFTLADEDFLDAEALERLELEIVRSIGVTGPSELLAWVACMVALVEEVDLLDEGASELVGLTRHCFLFGTTLKEIVFCPLFIVGFFFGFNRT